MVTQRSTGVSGRRARLAGAVLASVAVVSLGATAGASTKSEHVVKVERVAPFGEVLFSAKGFALYTYAHDTKNHSTCTGGCLAAWPAFDVARGVRPTGVAGLATMRRSNGKLQVTWRGRPLYTFASDATRNKVTGNGVGDFHVARLSTSKVTTTTRSYGY